MIESDIDSEKKQACAIDQKTTIATLLGNTITELPRDLYIPPDALEVILEIFSGPLDLLLYLIRKNNIDILDIPVAEITKQYVHYIEIMKVFQVELAAEYLEMAAILIQIKSRMLLPKPENTEEEADPRAELVRRLQEYEQFKKAAENLNDLERFERDFYLVSAKPPEITVSKPQPEVDLSEVLQAFYAVLNKAELEMSHCIQLEALSVRERMSSVLSQLEDSKFTELTNCLIPKEGKLGVIVTFLAVLELLKESMIELVQAEPFAPIYVRAVLC